VSSTLKTIAAWNTRENRLTGAYVAVVAFWVFYYYRPEDIFTVLYAIPVAKILGTISLVALIFGILGQGGRVKLGKEAKLVLLLFGQCVLCIPFASWRGGAFKTVFEDFSKVVIMTVIIGIAVTSVSRVRRLLWIQASATATMAIIGCLFYRDMIRLQIGNGLYGNANDFAIMIALNLPICFGFMVATRNPLKKIFWGVGLLGMLWAVTLTYSRSGFFATMVALGASFWEFAIKGRRKHMIVAGVILAILLLPVLIPSHYGTRLMGIFNPSIDPMDKGSADARRRLLIMSIELTLRHPIFGVGPGQFENVTKTWFVTHNTYTQLSSETGIVGLVLFILILWQVFRNLSSISHTERYQTDPRVKVLVSALRASFVGYLVGAFFASYGYELFIYALIAFTGVLYLACEDTVAVPAKKKESLRAPHSQPVAVG
jgi:O-antigen ligase